MVDFLNDKLFAPLKYTLLNSGGNEEFKSDLLEYINVETDTDTKEFFYYMLPYVRFIVNSDDIAYTTPLKAICLCVPHPDVKTVIKNWYFIYLHECLHQLWDTFGAEDEVREKLGECDHYIMNIASDCVINEFLHNNNHFNLKFPTDDLVTAEFLSSEYGVTYDFKHDTQVSLYDKLIAVKDKIYKKPPKGQKPPKIDKKTDEYVKGWNQAIEDYKAGKIKI